MSDTKEILRICACDNEDAELLLLEQTLQNVVRERLFPWSLEICDCRDWEGVLTACRTNTFHLIILDIIMPQRLQAEQNNPPIVFVSRHEQHVYDTFEYSPFCFVKKSCLEQDLEKTLRKYRTHSASFQIRYKALDGYSNRSLLLKDILYFECNAHDISIDGITITPDVTTLGDLASEGFQFTDYSQRALNTSGNQVTCFCTLPKKVLQCFVRNYA